MNASVATPIPTHKPQAHFAQLDGVSGIITKIEDHVIFVDTETNAVTTITPANALQVLVLDAVEHWVEQYYADMQAARLARVAYA